MTLHPQALEAARIDAAFDAFLQLQELPYIPGKDPRDAIRAAIATYLEASAPAEVGELVERYSVLLSEDDRGPIATMVVDETGAWVKATTLLALQAKCNALEGERDEARARIVIGDAASRAAEPVGGTEPMGGGSTTAPGQDESARIAPDQSVATLLSKRDAKIARLREALELAEPQLRALGNKTAGAPIALAAVRAVLTAEAGE